MIAQGGRKVIESNWLRLWPFIRKKLTQKGRLVDELMLAMLDGRRNIRGAGTTLGGLEWQRAADAAGEARSDRGLAGEESVPVEAALNIISPGGGQKREDLLRVAHSRIAPFTILLANTGK